jgi:hypothetical protein
MTFYARLFVFVQLILSFEFDFSFEIFCDKIWNWSFYLNFSFPK